MREKPKSPYNLFYVGGDGTEGEGMREKSNN